MNIHAKLGTALLVLGALGAAVYKFVWPQVESRLQIDATDARGTKGRIVVGTDNWIGYFPLCSDELRKRMRAAGYVLSCEDDKADYKSRFERLKAGEIQLAVATVDAYLVNGGASGFPGAVVAVIDESKGGDALVAWKDKASSIESLKAQRTPTIAFTPGSPSEHLLRSTAVHFDVPVLRSGKGAWRVETSGSPDALKALLDKRVDAAVLWEPDVSRALATAGVVRLLSTADTQRLIVDVLVAGRSMLQQPDVVQTLLTNYFDVLRHYREQPEQLARDVAAQARIDAAHVKPMLGGVAWAGLSDNAQTWLGPTPGSRGLVDAIQSTLRVLLESGAIGTNPLPDQDPYRITNSQFVGALYAASTRGIAEVGANNGGTGLDQRFSALDEARWDLLREVGTLKSLQVGFQSGAAELTYDGKVEIDRMMDVLKHYPTFRIRVRGHTALAGDDQENQRLSLERAEAVARYLQVTYNVDPNRTRVMGLGSKHPLARLDGESDRSYQYRLPRVEMSLLSEAL